MKPFAILDPKTSILQKCLLEASAGTGKTFTIEHLYIRLLLEKEDFSIDNLLIVTFTKKATRELKLRIFQTLSSTLKALKEEKLPFLYLSTYLNYTAEKKERVLRKLEDTLKRFDSALIFTIHGFCLKMLQEFSFEAGQSFILEESSSKKSFYPVFSRFLKNLSTPDFSPWDMSVLLRAFPAPTQIFSKVLQILEEEELTEPETLSSIRLALEKKLLFAPTENLSFFEEDFSIAEKNYKKASFKKTNFEQEITILKKFLENRAISQEAFQYFLTINPSLDSFFQPDNQKVKAKDFHWKKLSSYPIWKWLLEEFYPVLQKAFSVKRAIHCLSFAFSPIWKSSLENGDYSSPSEILRNMHKATDEDSFCKKVQEKCKAAIVDEFQDTDPIQWDILWKLFQKSPAFYLVGDPKQSIYGFRKADIYTYLSAKEALQTTYSLDTNYRSTPSLVDSLNTLFTKQKTWISLPKQQTFLRYEKVKAAKIETEKKESSPLCFFAFDSEKYPKTSAKELEQIFFFPFILEKIHEKEHSSDTIAILVKDRFQGRALQTYLEKRGVTCSCKSSLPLGKTFAAKSFKELIFALFDYPNSSLTKIFLLGPFSGWKVEELSNESFLEKAQYSLSKLQDKLFTSFSLFVSDLLESSFSTNGKTLKQMAYLQGVDFFEDFFQTLEFFLQQEQKLNKDLFFQLFEELEEEMQEDALGNKRAQDASPKTTILTTHASKGLEFDIVFAYGIAYSQTRKNPLIENQEVLLEQDAEKLRQLYVALTRAKKELFIPLILPKNKPLQIGTATAIEIFFSYLLHSEPYKVLQSDEILAFIEECPGFHLHFVIPNNITPKKEFLQHSQKLEKPLPLPIFPKETSVFSFSSLQKNPDIPKELPQEFLMPRGAAFGNFVHTCLEKLLLTNNFEETLTRLISHSPYRAYSVPLTKMFTKVFSIPFPSNFCLQNMPKNHLWPELEFIFETESSHKWIKGFVDLIFLWEGKYYLLDWKTNDLGNKEENYDEQSILQEMQRENYFLQASLYTAALRKYFHLHNLDFTAQFGGMYYIFLRGLFFNRGIYHFYPDASYAKQVTSKI